MKRAGAVAEALKCWCTVFGGIQTRSPASHSHFDGFSAAASSNVTSLVRRLVAGRALRGPAEVTLLDEAEEHPERLRLDDEDAARPFGVVVEVLMHGIVVDHHDVAGPPVVPLAVVHLVPVTFEDVEERLVLMPVVVRDPARRLGLDVDLERLRSEGLHGRTEHVLVPVSGPALPREVLRLDDARQGEPPTALLVEA